MPSTGSLGLAGESGAGPSASVMARDAEAAGTPRRVLASPNKAPCDASCYLLSMSDFLVFSFYRA